MAQQNPYLPPKADLSDEKSGRKPTQAPFRKAFAWAGIWLVLLCALSLATGNFSAEQFGSLTGLTGMAAGGTGLQAKNSRKALGFWRVGLWYVGVLILIVLIVSAGKFKQG